MFRTRLFLVTILLCLSTLASSQTPTPTTTFSINASVLQLGNVFSGSTAAADVGGTLQFTNNIALRSDNILAPAANFQGYFGGLNYTLPTGWLKKTKLSPNQFQPYLTGSVGVGINSQLGTTKQGIGELLGGGINYSPNNNGKFTVNIIELRYAHLPGFNNSTVVASSGIGLTF